VRIARWVTATMTAAVMPLTMASNCDAGRREERSTIGPAPTVDVVVGKLDPRTSRQKCWELRIAKKGSTNATVAHCVARATWDGYAVGDKFP
jgi:hypothetical protein